MGKSRSRDHLIDVLATPLLPDAANGDRDLRHQDDFDSAWHGQKAREGAASPFQVYPRSFDRAQAVMGTCTHSAQASGHRRVTATVLRVRPSRWLISSSLLG